MTTDNMFVKHYEVRNVQSGKVLAISETMTKAIMKKDILTRNSKRGNRPQLEIVPVRK